jgi:hypothetical protein
MARMAYATGALLVSQLALPGGQAVAQEYCVACSEPAGLYRCIIEGAQPRGGQSLQMLCVTAMAKEGRHATCSVKRGTVFECDGAVKRVPWAALNSGPPQEASRPANAQPAPAPAPPPPSKAEPAAGPGPAPDPPPPQTMVDLAKQANEKATAQMKKAGENIQETSKKTWNCVFSLFTRCGGE